MASHPDQHLSELMRRAQEGERGAYRALLQETAHLVRVFARKRVSEQDLEDVVQETLLSIHRHRHTFDPTRPFAPWMYGIARHRVLDAVRRRDRRASHELLGELDADDCSTPETSDGLAALIQSALAQLSEPQREVIQLLKLEGYTVSEISGRTGRSESLVKITAHRGYKVLRSLIARAFDDQ